MAHYAELDDANVVLRVLVVHDNDAPTEEAGAAFLASLFGGRWVKTQKAGGPRKNYAVPGGTYDPVRDGFFPPRPGGDYTLDEASLRWRRPPAVEAAAIAEQARLSALEKKP